MTADGHALQQAPGEYYRPGTLNDKFSEELHRRLTKLEAERRPEEAAETARPTSEEHKLMSTTARDTTDGLSEDVENSDIRNDPELCYTVSALPTANFRTA